MHMDAIAILNDAVGGITVNVSEDFSSVDPAIGMGEVKLMGEHAIHYVRTRKEIGDQKNISRIQRQQKYLYGFVAAFREKQSSDYEWIINAYEQAQPYMVTDCSANAISGMVDRFSGYRINEVAIPEGQNVPGKESFEFYVDAEKLDALILRLFYAPKG
jgi:anionic cell wall polymer biosynthesis LytR-Cps2A-Psr (LCP) family protein